MQKPRDFVIPLALVGAILVFFVIQVRQAPKRPRRSPAETSAATPVSPQGSAADSQVVFAQPLAGSDSAASGAPSEVTIQQSSRAAPRIDTPYVRELIREGSPGTYMRDLLAQQENLLMRWPDRFSAMRVFIEREVALADWNPEYPVVAERAFEEWQQAGFPLRFDMVLRPTEVDIRIKWIERFPPDAGQRIGLAQKVRDQHGWLVSSEIIVATHDSAGRPLAPELVAGTLRHEVGHALGLGHSGSTTDVMYPESRTPAISAADRKTLRLLYLLPPGRMP